MVILKHKIIFPFFLVSFLFSLESCHKDPDPAPVVEKVIWQRVIGMDNDVGFMNSAYINNHLDVITPAIFYRNVSLPEETSASDIFYMGIHSAADRLKFPVADQFYVVTDVNKLIIRSTSSVQSESTEKIIDLKALDSAFIQLYDLPYWQGECVGLSESGFVLVPYQKLTEDKHASAPYFVLAKVNVAGNNQIDTQSLKLVKNDFALGSASVYGIQSFYDKFFCRMGGGTFSIDTIGNLKQILGDQVFLNIFQLGDILYGFDENWNTDRIDYYKSSDHGESWTLIGNINVPLLGALQYTLIGDKVIGYYKGQIFQFEFTDTTYNVSELDNEGLGFADITSISLVDNSTVFVTSHCNSFSNNCGGFYKPLSHFFEKKKD